ncbi:MAG: LPS export ABC transporter periplasmic protein LptC [Bacteroidetes bacterium]|nr:MAG: LPS export ABC transporter periplasmic protein LptC [Bacteroidota bacterium]
MNAKRISHSFILFLIAVFFLSACENNEKDLPQFRKKQVIIDEGKQIIAYMSENAKVKAKLTSPYMLRNEMDSPYIEFPRTLHVDFYNDSMQIESLLDARYGKWRENVSKVFLKDSVVVKNIAKGDTLHCQELWWDQKAEKFYTDKPVRIHKKGGTIIYGTGLEAPQDFSGYTIFQITGPFAFPEKGFK